MSNNSSEYFCTLNVTDNCTRRGGPGDVNVVVDVIATLLQIIICIAGLFGNGLVIFVILRYAKMKTVTNMYILNLAVADMSFLIGLPLLIVTMFKKYWIFGVHVCKIFLILTSTNWFTSVFSLAVMGTDRYLAVCHPITSMRYRTPLISKLVCLGVWTLSLLVMVPVILYANLYWDRDGLPRCTILWPSGQPIPPDKAFVWYTFLLAFAIPVSLIVVFYSLVLARLKRVGPHMKQSKEKKKSHRKVTRMVLTVIAVYVICWLPFWIFQVHLTFLSKENSSAEKGRAKIIIMQFLTVFSYANSMLNPILYAFLSDNFRKSFAKAFKCSAAADVNSALTVETSVLPRRTQQNSNRSCNVNEIPSDDDDIDIGNHDKMELANLNSRSIH
ncbi:somatostatin receptor type 2-like [Tubulanus polymorphus]|uniref:somatostatin receptor type 2-like n=1 Tax=Tubulanus polymorphus TaxID=672921 RepID=UPI003DA2F12B